MGTDPTEENALQFYGVSPDLLRSIIQALEEKDEFTVISLISPLHAADVADVLQNLDEEHLSLLLEYLRPTFDPEVLSYLEDAIREDVISFIGTQDLAAALSDLESDDALSVIEDLNQKQQREVLRAISAEDRAILEEVLTYPEDSAGRLMQREVAVVPSFWTVKEAVNYLSTNRELPDIFYNLYVVDPKHHPIGQIPLSRLLKHSLETPIENVLDSEIHKIPVAMDKEEVAHMFQHYNLMSAPVVDSSGRLVGMITADDIVDVIEEEVTEDIMLLAGTRDADFYASAPTTFIMRFRWLFVTLINTILAATVISQFQDSIQKLVALAVLMPIVTAMSGNSGMQVVTVTVRALATRDLREGNVWKTLTKELVVGFMNGTIFAVLLGGVSAVFFHDTGLGVVLGGAVIFNMIWAAFAGVSLPVFINKIGQDPALSAGPLLTTTTDTLGFAVFLGLAKALLL